MNAFSERLRTLRVDAGLSVRGLAERIGKTPGYVSRIEARGEIPSPELICELARELGVRPEELLDLAKKSHLEKAAQTIEEKQRTALNLFRKAKE